jgi:hypothetical protein
MQRFFMEKRRSVQNQLWNMYSPHVEPAVDKARKEWWFREREVGGVWGPVAVHTFPLQAVYSIRSRAAVTLAHTHTHIHTHSY